MWWVFFVVTYIVFAVAFTQLYKVVLKTSKADGALTILLQVIAGITALVISLFLGGYAFPTDWKIYLLLGLACIFYAIADRLNTTVRSGVEASTFSILKQLSTVFMIVAGLLFFREPFVWRKIIGAILIIASNVLIFYKPGKQKIDRYVALGIISNLVFSVALFLDVNLSENFNIAFYTALTLLVPALFIAIGERIKPAEVLATYQKGDKKMILATGISWGIMLVVLLAAYNTGEVTTVAPLCALTAIGNVFIGYAFLKERDALWKKILAALIIIISVILIKG